MGSRTDQKRQSSAPLLLSGFEEIIKDKMELSCSASSIYYFIKKKDIKVAIPPSNDIVGTIEKSV